MIKIINSPTLYDAMSNVAKYCQDYIGDKMEIIAPDKFNTSIEKFLYEKMNISSSFNLKVNSLGNVAKKAYILEDDNQISKVGSILLIHKILNNNISNLKVLKSKGYSFTYAENIYKTIIQLKNSNISYEEMLAYKSSEEQLTNKIQDLALIYKNYEEEKGELIDSSDELIHTINNISDTRQNKKIIFVGFDDFTELEYLIIEKLSTNNEVMIFNTMSEGNNKHIYNHRILERLNNSKFSKSEIEYRDNKCDKIKNYLAENLFGIKDNKYDGSSDTIRIFSANNIVEEIEYVARDIRKKILNGASYSQFGVSIFGLENNIVQIQEIFNKYKINAYFDSELCINKSIFYKFLISVLKFYTENYNLCHLIDIIQSPFFSMNLEEKMRLIVRLKEVNFNGIINNGISLGEHYNNSLKSLVEFLNNINIIRIYNAEEIINNIKIFIEKNKIHDTLNNIANKMNNAQNKIILLKSYDIIIELFDEILKFNKNISLDDFIDIFEHISSVLKINNLPQCLDVVKVVDADSQVETFDHMYIINCASDVAPNLKYDCGIILDTEIEKLNFRNTISPTVLHKNKLAKLKLFNTLSLFDKTLFISYSRGLPSEAVSDIMNRLDIRAESNFCYGKYEALSDLDLIDYLCKNDKNNEKIDEKVLKNKYFSTISKENLNIFENMKSISASKLESYFDCPFNTFLNYQLSIKPRLSNEIQSFDIGTMLHDVVYKYYKLDKCVGDVYEFCRDEIFAHLEKEERLKLNADSGVIVNLIDEAVRTLTGVDYLDKNSLFQVRKDLLEHDFSGVRALRLKNIDIIGKIDRVDEYSNMLRIIDYKSGKANANLKELYYGHKLQLFLYSSAIENELNEKVVGCFYLPLHNEYTREVGNTYALNGFFINENDIVQAFDKRLEPNMKSDIVNVNMTSNGLARQTIGYKEVNSQQMSKLMNYAKKVSEKAVDEIRSGYIEPNPSDISKPCSYCPYAHICMRKSAGISYRSNNDVKPMSFEEGDNG